MRHGDEISTGTFMVVIALQVLLGAVVLLACLGGCGADAVEGLAR